MQRNLPIEEHPEILQEYGRALAYINLVEALLENIIRFSLDTKQPEFLDKIFSEMMLGKKINTAESIIGKDVTKDLWKLNKARITLVHGVTGIREKDDGSIRKGDLYIWHKSEIKPLTKDYLTKTTEKAKIILSELFKIMNKIIKEKLKNPLLKE